MTSMDIYMSIGCALELLAASPYHRQHDIRSYLQVEILPPLTRGQCRFYLTQEAQPVALVTWGWLSAEVEAELHATGRALEKEEWACGDRLFYNDVIVPYGNLGEVIRDFSHNIFPEECATGLRRNMDGTVRRVQRWMGVRCRHGEKHRNGAAPGMSRPVS